MTQVMYASHRFDNAPMRSRHHHVHGSRLGVESRYIAWHSHFTCLCGPSAALSRPPVAIASAVTQSTQFPTYVISNQHGHVLAPSLFTMDAASSGLPTSRHFVTQLLDSLAAPSSIDQTAAPANPLKDVSDATRKQLLSLQVLFPNEFVPALDLLDRRLVTRFRICSEAELAARATHAEQRDGVVGQDVQMQDTETEAGTETHAEPHQPSDTETSNADTHDRLDVTTTFKSTAQAENTNTTEEPVHLNTIHYVRSAQHRTSRYTTSYDTLTTYQVRLQSWNCSCPAFAFAAFPAGGNDSPSPFPHDNATRRQSEGGKGGRTWMFGGISLGNGMPPICKHLLACVLVERCGRLFGEFVEERHVGVEEAAGWAAGWGD
jgi:hypothetical protein